MKSYRLSFWSLTGTRDVNIHSARGNSPPWGFAQRNAVLGCKDSRHNCEESDSSTCITARRGGRDIKKYVAKPPCWSGRGGFPSPNKRKTTPSAPASVASRHSIDDAATPPCGDARRG